MNDDLQKTVRFDNLGEDNSLEVKKMLLEVFSALEEKGYDPIVQMVGYFISGDPSYITNHRNARAIIRKKDRDELLGEILKFYIKANKNG